LVIFIKLIGPFFFSESGGRTGKMGTIVLMHR